MKYFKGIEEIKNAEVSELLDIPGMNVKSAESVYNFFHVKTPLFISYKF